MIMSAGAGTRLRPLTHNIPKPLMPIVNRPVLEHTLNNVRRSGITEVALNLHAYADMVHSFVGDGSAWGLTVHYSHEKKLLGTAGGVKKLEPFLKTGTFLVMSGDGLTDIDLKRVLAFHRRKRAFATMVLKPVDTRFEYGVTVTNRDGRIRKFIEKPLWSDVFSNTVNTGIYVFEPGIFRYIPSRKIWDFGHNVWPDLLARGERIFGYVMPEYWCDIGNLQEYHRGQNDALSGAVKVSIPGKQLRRGVWVGEHTSIHPKAKLEAPCVIGKHCRIASGARIGGHTSIGNHVIVHEGAVITQSILWDRVVVHHRARLHNCIIGYDEKVRQNVSLHDGSLIHTNQA